MSGGSKGILLLALVPVIAAGVWYGTNRVNPPKDPAATADGSTSVSLPTVQVAPKLPEKPTFAEHIAPLMFDECVTCHRPGQVAPFSLIEYEDVKRRGRQLVEVTQSRYMPPFLPDADKTRFQNARHLHANQIEMLKRWVDQGAPKGDMSLMPPVPEFSSDWQLGPPDLLVSMDREYTLPAEGENVFRHFVIPIPNEKLQFIRGFEFRTSNPRIVHHARFLFDRTEQSRLLDEADPEPGFSIGMGTGAARDPEGHWLGWTPGKQPVLREPKYAWPLSPKLDLVIEVHMLPTGKPEPIKCEVGFYYSDQAPTDLPAIIRMGPTTIDIAPGQQRYVHEEQFRVPVDVDLLNVYPHAHLLAKSMRSFATLPGGKRVCLLDIDDWDFNWQDEYQYAEPIRLPAGSIIDMKFTYDNSADNVRNPHSPPKRVTQGAETFDEMGDLWFQMVPTQPRNRAALMDSIYRREALWLVRQAKFLADEKPTSTSLAKYGMVLHAQKRFNEARGYLKRALQLDPKSPAILNNLGFVEMSMGNYTEAARLLERALSIRKDSPDAVKNMGIVRSEQKRYSDAIPWLRKAVEQEPKHVRSWLRLAIAYSETDELEAARQCADYVLKLDPSCEPAMDLRVRLQAKSK